MKSINPNPNISHTRLLAVSFMLLVCSIASCKKYDEWLDVKRANSNVIPNNLKDLQAVLDNTNTMTLNHGQLGLIGADNNIIPATNLSTATVYERNSYLWSKDIFQGDPAYDWQYAYQRIGYSNIVLDALEKIDPNSSNQVNYNNIKGSALFHRSLAFYQLASVFCRPYSSTTAGNDLGVPIRLSSDVNIPSVRATVQQTYSQIVQDLNTATALLPQVPLYTTRPSSVAAHALLAKVYLSMEDYQQAGHYANLALEKFPTLLDFKSSAVSPTSTYRFPVFNVGNPEIIFYASTSGYPTLWPVASGTGTVDPVLYDSYLAGDLRKAVFYQNTSGRIKFQGTYTGIGLNFGGIATNEIYLIRAECYARANNTEKAMADLNKLLQNRFTSPYTNLAATDTENALMLVLRERRKELPYTAQLRWEDLRRLNKDPRFAKTLSRTYNGVVYTLPPNDKRYVFPIPEQEVQLFGLPQNER